jgi:hypothetical protein
LQGEVAFGDGGEALHPIGDVELLGCDVLRHRKPPSGNPERAGIAEEL